MCFRSGLVCKKNDVMNSPFENDYMSLLHGLWGLANYIKTHGKGYAISDGDGLAYSYSVFNNYRLIKSQCKSVYILNTKGSDINPYRSAAHVAILGIKETPTD